MKTITSEKGEAYYQSVYWNDFKRILDSISKDITGDENKWWAQDFKERFASTSFRAGISIKLWQWLG